MAKTNYGRMNARALAAATSEYDEPGTEPKFLRPPPAEKSRHARALRRAKRGRPTVGAGATKIHTCVEATLLARADELAKKRGATRAQIIAEGLRLVLRAS